MRDLFQKQKMLMGISVFWRKDRNGSHRKTFLKKLFGSMSILDFYRCCEQLPVSQLAVVSIPWTSQLFFFALESQSRRFARWIILYYYFTQRSLFEQYNNNIALRLRNGGWFSPYARREVCARPLRLFTCSQAPWGPLKKMRSFKKKIPHSCLGAACLLQHYR